MVDNSGFAKSVLKLVHEKLNVLSFSKKTGGGFYKDLGKDTQGYVGLNLATKLPNGRIGISPIVGISYRPVANFDVSGRASGARTPLPFRTTG
jgi:hypothetical protein